MKRERSQRRKQYNEKAAERNLHLPEPDVVQSFDADGYKLVRFYVRIGNEALSIPRVETKTTRNYCFLWSSKSTTLTEALVTARKKHPGFTNAPVYHAGSNDVKHRIDKSKGQQTLEEAGIKPGDWLLMIPPAISVVSAAVQKVSHGRHPKHELAPKPTTLVLLNERANQCVRDEHTVESAIVFGSDKPPVTSLFHVKPNSHNNEEATPRRIRGLYISHSDIVDCIDDDHDSVGQYMESFLVAIRGRLALELAIEPKCFKRSVESRYSHQRPAMEAVEGVDDRWLVELLKEEDWWIPTRRHAYVRRRLGSKAPIPPQFAVYARDIYCWYPIHRWKVVYD
jgi:hypothetical protein